MRLQLNVFNNHAIVSGSRFNQRGFRFDNLNSSVSTFSSIASYLIEKNITIASDIWAKWKSLFKQEQNKNKLSQQAIARFEKQSMEQLITEPIECSVTKKNRI